MPEPADRTPVLVGVGQCVQHWNGANTALAPSPQSLMCRAARAAMDDCGAASIADTIDVIAVTRLFADSMAGLRGAVAFGACNNLPRHVAKQLGIAPRRAIYSVVGGQTPQALVSEFAQEIYAGRANTVLLTGGEAISAAKLALRQGLVLDWSDHAEGDIEDRGFGPRLLNSTEVAHGLGAPTSTYSLFEHALRARIGKTRDEHAADMAELWHRFSKVAAAGPYAQFPQVRSAEFLRTASAQNYPIADPYLKWHVAQDAVNQGASLILTSAGRAGQLGIAPEKWVYLHGHAEAEDKRVSARQNLSRSLALEGTLQLAMQTADVTVDDIAHFDLYSCFPCAVFLAAEALGIDWRARQLTLTGGLPFFGGAGNNYAMHAIAAMVEKLRANPLDFGLLAANGGFLSKQAVGIYSARPKADFQPVSSAAIQAEIGTMPSVVAAAMPGNGVVESYTVAYRKGVPHSAIVMVKDKLGGRVVTQTHADLPEGPVVIAALLDPDTDPLGRRVRTVVKNARNIVASIH